MTSTMRKGLIVAALHVAIVGSLGAKLLIDRTLGGTWGPGPGQFHFVTDCVQDPAGNFYVSEYGEYDRIQKFTPDHHFLFQWGSHGNELGQFLLGEVFDVEVPAC